MLPGAGATEIELGRCIEAMSEKLADIRQYSVKNFALALESFPKQLAENAGLKVAKFLEYLVYMHRFLANRNVVKSLCKPSARKAQRRC